MDGELNTCNRGEKGRQYILLYIPAHTSLFALNATSVMN